MFHVERRQGARFPRLSRRAHHSPPPEAPGEGGGWELNRRAWDSRTRGGFPRDRCGVGLTVDRREEEMLHCVGVCPRLAPSARRPVPIVEHDGREKRRRGRPSWKERGDRHPGPAAPSLALPDREWGRRPHGVSTHPGGLCPSCSDRVASTAPEHECDKREAPGASPLVAGGPGRTAHPDGSQRRHPGQLRQTPIRRHAHRDGYSAPRIRTQPPNRTAPMEARPRVRRLSQQHGDHREEASRSWTRPVAESAVAASVKWPYEGQSRKPSIPFGLGR